MFLHMIYILEILFCFLECLITWKTDETLVPASNSTVLGQRKKRNRTSSLSWDISAGDCHRSHVLWALVVLLPLYSLLLHLFMPRPLCSFASVLILPFASVLISFSISRNFSKSDVYGSISSCCFSDGFKICNFI